MYNFDIVKGGIECESVFPSNLTSKDNSASIIFFFVLFGGGHQENVKKISWDDHVQIKIFCYLTKKIFVFHFWMLLFVSLLDCTDLLMNGDCVQFKHVTDVASLQKFFETMSSLHPV